MSEQKSTVEEFADSLDEDPPQLITGVAWSEIESVPKDWEVDNLESKISITTGNNFSSDHFVDEGGIPLIRIRDLDSDTTTVNYTGEYDDKYLIQDFDLLVGMDGEFEPHFWSGGRALLNQRVCRIEPDQTCNKVFLRYAIEKPLWYIQKSIAGTTVKHLSQSNIRDINLPTPPLEEQRKIASVLYTVDQAIQKTDEVVSRKRRLKKGAVQNLLTRGLGDNKLQEGRVGAKLVEYPPHWQVKLLGELCNITGGKRLPKGHDYAEEKTDYPYLRVVDFADGTIDKSDLRYLSEKTYQEINKYTISSDDVYISIAGTLGLAGTVPAELDGANLTENAAKCCNLEGVENEFLKIYLRSSLGQAEVHRWTVGTSQPKLALYRLRKFEVLVPPVEEQIEIMRIINTLNHNVRMSSQLRDQLTNLKSALMQDLLSGEVRTHNKDIEIVDEVLAHG